MNYNNKDLFLAFLNREISFIKEKKFTEDELSRFTKLCALMTNGELFGSFAQVHEIVQDSKELNSLFHELCKNGKLNLINGEMDFPCFLDRRRKMYHARKNRYKNYFLKTQPLKDIYKRSQKLNTTNHIKQRLQEFALGHRGANFLQAEHKAILEKNRGFIIDTLPDPELAATFSVYEKQKIGPNKNGARLLGDISSKLFSQHYSNEHYLISPTGIYNDEYIEDYDHFPFFDVKLFYQYISRVGIDVLVRDKYQSRLLFQFICNSDFHAFIEVKNHFFSIMNASVSNNFPDAMCDTPYSEFIRNYPFPDTSKVALGEPIVIVEAISKSLTTYIGENEHTGLSLEREMKEKLQRSRIVVFTATDLEDEILRTGFLLSGLKFIGTDYFDNVAYNIYALYDKIHIFHVRTSAGSGGVHGSALASAKFLAMPDLSYAISVGICFGIDRTKQSPGDVIVAESVYPYELAAARNGRLEFRGTPIPTDPLAVSHARTARASLNGKYSILTGAILSGEKLIDDADFKSKMLEYFPRAIGGEMECAGLAASALARNIPFSMVKGICDFAEGKTDDYQEMAAENAVQIAIDLIKSRWN